MYFSNCLRAFFREPISNIGFLCSWFHFWSMLSFVHDSMKSYQGLFLLFYQCHLLLGIELTLVSLSSDKKKSHQICSALGLPLSTYKHSPVTNSTYFKFYIKLHQSDIFEVCNICFLPRLVVSLSMFLSINKKIEY